jgi:hypothetical protein
MRYGLKRFFVLSNCIIFFVWGGFFFSNQPAICQDFRGIQVSPDHEKRSCIQEVDGYAFLSEDMTISQTRAAAFSNAKRQAVEMAQTFIQSKTQIENFILKFDQVTADTAGAVTILEQKDLGIEDNTRYHVWIKAEVEYAISPQGGSAAVPDVMDKGKPLTVKVWTSKKSYKAGETIEIYVQGNRDFYARILNVTSRGDIIQLLPNEYRRINFFKSGKVYKIPDKGDQFDLKVAPPYGEDQIMVYASEVPLGEVDMEKIGQGLGRFRGSRNKLSFQTRGLKVVASKQGFPSGAEFYEATWTLTTGQ